MKGGRDARDDALAALIVEHAQGNAPGLPAHVAHDIAEDVLSALRLRGLQVRAMGSRGQRAAPPPPGTICEGVCNRPLYTLTSIGHDRSRLPEGAATHHARGRCNSCDGKARREKARTA